MSKIKISNNLLVVASLIISLIAAQENTNEQTPSEPKKRVLPPLCREDLPTLSVYDIMIDTSNWDR